MTTSKKLSKQELLEVARKLLQKEAISTRADSRRAAIDADLEDLTDLETDLPGEVSPYDQDDYMDNGLDSQYWEMSDDDELNAQYPDSYSFEDDREDDDYSAWRRERDEELPGGPGDRPSDEDVDFSDIDDEYFAKSDRLERKGGHVPFTEDAIKKPKVENWDDYEVNEEMKKGDFTKRVGKGCADVAKSLKKKFGKDSGAPFAIAQSMSNKGQCEEDASLEEAVIRRVIRNVIKEQFSVNMMATPNAEPVKSNGNGVTAVIGREKDEKEETLDMQQSEARVADPSKEGGVQSQVTIKKKAAATQPVKESVVGFGLPERPDLSDGEAFADYISLLRKTYDGLVRKIGNGKGPDAKELIDAAKAVEKEKNEAQLAFVRHVNRDYKPSYPKPEPFNPYKARAGESD